MITLSEIGRIIWDLFAIIGVFTVATMGMVAAFHYINRKQFRNYRR